jgi:myo-inositol-1(or 4)-monophosphatase
LIDPLDGTTNYTTQIPFFAVSIASAKNKEVVLGAVYDPMHGNLYSAEKGEGAKLNDSPMRISATEDLRQSMVGYTRPAKVKERFVEMFSKVELATRTPKILGSAVLTLCLAANGNLDAAILISPNPWDMAAGSLLVQEAGGKITDFEGKPWSLESKDILATNGKIHQELLEIINS